MIGMCIYCFKYNNSEKPKSEQKQILNNVNVNKTWHKYITKMFLVLTISLKCVTEYLKLLKSRYFKQNKYVLFQKVQLQKCSAEQSFSFQITVNIIYLKK